jgi:hypothetical protein
MKLEDLTVGVMYTVVFPLGSVDVILKESSRCVLIATKDIQPNSPYRLLRAEYILCRPLEAPYTINELTESEELKLFTDLL